MQLLGIAFILYLLKLSAGNGVSVNFVLKEKANDFINVSSLFKLLQGQGLVMVDTLDWIVGF